MLGPSPLLSRHGVPQHIGTICASRAGWLYPAPSTRHASLGGSRAAGQAIGSYQLKVLDTVNTVLADDIPPPPLQTHCIQPCRLESPHTPRVTLLLHPTTFYTLPFPLQGAARQNSKSEWPLNQFLGLVADHHQGPLHITGMVQLFSHTHCDLSLNCFLSLCVCVPRQVPVFPFFNRPTPGRPVQESPTPTPTLDVDTHPAHPLYTYA